MIGWQSGRPRRTGDSTAIGGTYRLILQENPVPEDRERRPRRSAAGLSLRTRLLLLVVASVLPLLALNLGSQYLQYRAAVAATGQPTLELARSMSQVVEQELKARMVALQVLATSPALRGNDITALRAQAQAVIAQQFPGSNVILLRPDGQQLMNTLVPLDVRCRCGRIWNRCARCSRPALRLFPTCIWGPSVRGSWSRSTCR